ncbi:hypothetical protein MRS44_017018 [Fusarium solani]|uniref:uncharacterized protein n=1 Tax=Fusarium solani TaxID=169388 RepID=UPI0032C42710|nr:hypothetical protein MRS44_017018 [Fusarium solani]
MSNYILVTGANGFVAMHVIKLALELGYSVIGTIRSERAAESVRRVFPESLTRLLLIKVSDISKPGSFKPAFTARPVRAVINLASPLVNNPKDVKSEVLDPAIQSGTSILTAALQYGGMSVERVIHVSSFTACLDLSLSNDASYRYTSADWNPLTYDEAAEGGNMTAYMGSKALAEKAMWTWMRDQRPSYDMVSIVPSATFGPHVGPVQLDNVNLSTRMLWELVEPSPNPPVYNSRHLGSWIDVRDVAKCLLRAIDVPEAAGKRLLVAQRCHWQLVRDEARRVLPELRDRIEPGKPGSWKNDAAVTYDVDGTEAARILDIQYRPLHECLRDTYLQLLQAHKHQGNLL